MQKNSTFSFIITLLLLSIFTAAQPGKKPVVSNTDTAKGKLKLTASFGAYTNSGKAFAADLKRLLNANPQLKLKDDKGIFYTVVSFEITWKKKDISDDIRSGKQKTVYYYVGGNIKGNVLTDSWKEEIKGFVQKDEEITFGTILYFDAKKKVNVKGPSLVLTIL
jgi:hypothetical protein